MNNMLMLSALLLSASLAAAPAPEVKLYDQMQEQYISIRSGKTSGPVRFDMKKEQRLNTDLYTVTLQNVAKKDLGLRFTASIPFKAQNACVLVNPYTSEKAKPGQIYSNIFGGFITSQQGVGMNRYPFGTVARGNQIAAIGINPEQPAMFYTTYDASAERLNINIDLAIIPENPNVVFSFWIAELKSPWGFRAVLNQYYRLFPKDFVVRAKDQGICLAFAEPSRITNIEDFVIRYREASYGDRWDYKKNKPDERIQKRIEKEVAYGNTVNVKSFRYHEPGNFWLPLGEDFREAALKYSNELTQYNHLRAKALFACGYMSPDGSYLLTFSKQVWNNGCNWSMCTLPRIPSPDSTFNVYLKMGLASYEGVHANLAGEFFDSMGGYMRDPADYNRNSMKYASYPLIYDALFRIPALNLTLCQAEYAAEMTKRIHAKNRLAVANNSRNFLIGRNFDIFVGEMDWKLGKWKPNPNEELIFIRSMIKGKPYTILQKTNLRKFPPADVDRYMRRAVAFGLFPSFFSDRGTPKNYFRTPDYYNRDRHLFKKYLPICKIISEAGWEPVTLLRASHVKILTERYGKHYFTVYNDSMKPVKTVLTFDNKKICMLKCLLPSGKILKGDNGKFNIELGPEELLVLQTE